MNETVGIGKPQFSIKATVIRANGEVEELGVIVGGTLIQKISSYLRISLANAKQRLRMLKIKYS